MNEALLIKFAVWGAAEGMKAFAQYQKRVEAGEMTPEEMEAAIDDMIARQKSTQADLERAANEALGSQTPDL